MNEQRKEIFSEIIMNFKCKEEKRQAGTEFSQIGLTAQYPAKQMIIFPGCCGFYIDHAHGKAAQKMSYSDKAIISSSYTTTALYKGTGSYVSI